jgi:hypothetical protein
VGQTYDGLEKNLCEQVQRAAEMRVAGLLRAPLQIAVICADVLDASARAIQQIGAVEKLLPPRRPASDIFASAQRAVERRAGPGAPARSIWLGENWITDPIGLKSAVGASTPQRTTVYDRSVLGKLADRVRTLLAGMQTAVSPGSGREWLAQVRDTLAGAPEAAAALTELQRIADDGRPRIVFCGDYSAGKSSFIKRLLMDVGQAVPEGLTVRADPTTVRSSEFEWQGFVLVDTPGFQSGRAEHAEEAMRAVPDASLVLFLFQPNLLTGHLGHMDSVVKGDRAAGLLPKGQRAFFIINRSDELGPDPDESPEEFSQLTGRKMTELVQALRSRGAAVGEDRVLCMASDPFGLVGDRRDVDSAAFDRFRDWDGFRPFIASLTSEDGLLKRIGNDLSVLEGGSARLARLRASAVERAAAFQSRGRALSRIAAAVREAVLDGKALASKIEARLECIVEGHSSALLRDTLASVTDEEILARGSRLTQWWNDEAFRSEVDAWQNATASDIDRWCRATGDTLQRRLDSPEFKLAFGRVDAPGIDLDTLRANAGKGTGKWFADAGKTLGGATREAVLQIGHALGFKFAPWGAVKLAGKLRLFGAALGAVGVGYDIREWFRENKRAEDREENRKKLLAYVQESATRLTQQLLHGTDEEKGPLAVFADVRSEFAGFATSLDGERRALEGEEASYNQLAHTLSQLIAEAYRRLG